MKKFLSITFLIFGIVAASLIVENSSANAADTWIYTNSQGEKFYLRKASRDARTWASANIIKVSNKGSVSLIYIFEAYNDVPYAVYHGSDSLKARMGDLSSPIEKGESVYNNPLAAMIWDKYIPRLQSRT